MTDRPVIIGRRVWAGGYDPALTIWLHDSPHHWDDGQLVLHDDGREIRPEPGWLIVLWSDGMANAASPRVAERVYQPQPRGERVPLDHLTSDALDAPYEQLEAAEQTESERQLATARDALASATTRAARADATVSRARDVAHWIQRNYPGLTYVNERLTAALDEPSPTAAQATEPAGHVYLSTGCHHGDHGYCQSMTGLNGAKRPGECKHCGARCICGCHTEETP